MLQHMVQIITSWAEMVKENWAKWNVNKYMSLSIKWNLIYRIFQCVWTNEFHIFLWMEKFDVYRKNQIDAQIILSIFRQPLHVSGVSIAHHQEVHLATTTVI